MCSLGCFLKKTANTYKLTKGIKAEVGRIKMPGSVPGACPPYPTLSEFV
jgi:hypothetical protein